MSTPVSSILISFVEAGILILDEKKFFVFSSLLTKKYYTHSFLPERAERDPPTLRDVVVRSIESLSAKSINYESSLFPDRDHIPTFVHAGASQKYDIRNCNLLGAVKVCCFRH
jgi:hypothetical protein